MKTKFIELVMSHRVTIKVPEDYKYSVDDDSMLHQVSEESQAEGKGEWDLSVVEEPIFAGPFQGEDFVDATWLE
jgi:hypothetical protein